MLFALLVSRPALAQGVAQWRASVEEASRRFGVPVAWIESVMRAESAGKTRLGGRAIVSSAGAMGLMQLMPATWRVVRAKLGLGHDPHEPRDNILAGTYYLRMMHDQFGYPGLFAAYNAGPARYEQHLRGGRRLPAETRAYVAAVTGRRVVESAQIAEARNVDGRVDLSRMVGAGQSPRRIGAGIFFTHAGIAGEALSLSGEDIGDDTTTIRRGPSELFAIGGILRDR